MSVIREAIVIGSGPSGSAACRALINAGIRPTVIDGGLQSSNTAISLQEGARAAREDVGGATYASANPGQKSWFQSFFPYEQSPQSLIRYSDSIVARASFARGGFSRVWGATHAYFSQLDQWSADIIPAAEDLALVRSLVPSALTSWRPEGPRDGEVQGAVRSARVMREFVRNDRLGHWEAKAATVAIETSPSKKNACQGDGRCLSGCPFDSIWYAGDTVQQLARSGEIEYLPGSVARSVDEQRGIARVLVVGAGGVSSTLSAQRVFVAAGAISSAALMIQSGRFQSLGIRDTSTAFLGALAVAPQGRENANHHGLSQWWLRSTLNDRFSAQVYPPSKEHAQRLQKILPAGRLLSGPTQVVAGKLHPIIAYLKSDNSDGFTVSRSGTGVWVDGSTSRETKREFLSHIRKMGRVFARSGFFLPTAAVQFTAPGSGYHFGSSMPHGASTDYLGRLPGWDRIHVVDSSVLPTIEVGSVTPTIMANAARIARVASALRA